MQYASVLDIVDKNDQKMFLKSDRYPESVFNKTERNTRSNVSFELKYIACKEVINNLFSCEKTKLYSVTPPPLCSIKALYYYY